MPEFYETIFENGEHSVAMYADDEEASRAISEHVKRAKSGLPGGPTGHAAQRVVRVLVYKEHPANFGESQTCTVDELLARAKAQAKEVADENGVVFMPDFTQNMLTTNQAIDPTTAPHESNFKMKEARELESALWGGNE